jgi:hypothetical protein
MSAESFYTCMLTDRIQDGDLEYLPRMYQLRRKLTHLTTLNSRGEGLSENIKFLLTLSSINKYPELRHPIAGQRCNYILWNPSPLAMSHFSPSFCCFHDDAVIIYMVNFTVT